MKTTAAEPDTPAPVMEPEVVGLVAVGEEIGSAIAKKKGFLNKKKYGCMIPCRVSSGPWGSTTS